MPPPQLEEIIANLHLQGDHTKIFHLSTDRLNIFLTVHKMQHPVSSYHDLAFVIKQHMTANDLQPPKFLVFLIPMPKLKQEPNSFANIWHLSHETKLNGFIQE